jgi:hypothetical protein
MIVVYDEVIRLYIQQIIQSFRNMVKNIHENDRTCRPITVTTVGNAAREEELMLGDRRNTVSK